MTQNIAAENPAEAIAPPARPTSSSFYLAMKLLPPPRRDAMYEIYAFCRAVDDIADGNGPRPQRRADLQAWRNDIDAIYRGAAPARLAGLGAAVRQFDLRREDFVAVMDGMEMDLEQDIRAPKMTVFDLYCDRVASAVGRLSVRVFGMKAGPGEQLAYHLGRALQMTNILRDMDEDADVGRLYLPAEALHAAGIETTDPHAAIVHPGIGRACAPVVVLAREHFQAANEIMAREPRGATRAPRLMEAVYRRILDRLVSRGWTAPRKPVRINKIRLLWIVLSDSLF
jgi:presqualene diphosphate synthase